MSQLLSSYRRYFGSATVSFNTCVFFDPAAHSFNDDVQQSCRLWKAGKHFNVYWFTFDLNLLFGVLNENITASVAGCRLPVAGDC